MPGYPESLKMAFALPPQVSMRSAPALLAAGNAAVRAGESVFDLGAVTECDSSLLACLNEWRREARRLRGGTISVLNPPDAIKRIARLYGVEALTLG